MALTVATYLAMLTWTLPGILAEAGGLIPLELRLSGYTYFDAVAFLNELSPAGLALYRGPHAYLLAFFPALLALSMALPVNGLLHGRLIGFRLIGVLIPMFAAVNNYTENILMARMLSLGAERITPELVELTSRATVMKASFFSISAILTAALIIARWWDIRRGATE
ncbi:MAG: hypothetical protein AAFQ36_01235 [Pseudomonadota bacterium]